MKKLPLPIYAVFLFLITGSCSSKIDKVASVENQHAVPDTHVGDDTHIFADTLVWSDPQIYQQIQDTLNPSLIQEITSYKELLDLFEKHNYTPESWKAGIREIPRIYLTTISERWGSTTSAEITVLLKKQIFFRGLAPLILKSNEWIMMDRNRLKEIMSEFTTSNSMKENERIWLHKLAKLYKVKIQENVVSGENIEELWKRVDIIPSSLALSQGAEESGWGTSRFAAAGNALYGQWTWGKKSIVPEQQRKELGNYGIAAFGSLPESVAAYMLNLNTNNAYAALRDKRAVLRKNGEQVTGSILAEQLTKYSERGEEYVKTLKSMMDYNRLTPTDDAFLSKGPPIFLISAE